MVLRKIDNAIAARLKSARKLSGLNQKQLAETIEVSAQQIQKYESGENRIHAGRLWQIAEALDMPISYFFSESSNVDSTPVEAPAGSFDDDSRNQSPGTESLAQLLEQVKDEDLRDAIRAIIESYLESR
ncbi:MAG: helix-turn-helix transcriptional regulator [Kiloniellales bacterium]|nr:helix-turn-helix transcriptional regulator [Kiloniellales bacterium]